MSDELSLKEKTDNPKESYQMQMRVSMLSFLAELPNLIASVVAAAAAGTLICWVDCASSLESSAHCLIVLFFSRMILNQTSPDNRNELKRLEIKVSVLCDILVSFGTLSAVGLAVYELFNPQEMTGSLLWFILLKAVNTSFDIYFLAKQIQIGRSHASKLNETEIRVYVYYLLSDLAVGIIVSACYFLKDYPWSVYISPIASIILGIYFLAGVIKHINDSINELKGGSTDS